ncbi:MAG: hypothetical protein HZB38_15160 [Planctomycetes bacterium]|nr:hypothetical protein [Planctomycetota bacterium]
MTTIAASARPQARESVAFDPVRWFYPLSGLLLLAATAWGFQLFYFHGMSHPGRPIPPPIRTLIIVHGVAMSAWIMLFTIQPFLVALRRKKLHMTLGRFGVGLAAIVVVVGSIVGVRSAQVTPPDVRIWGLTAKAFMAVPLLTVLSFGGFVAVAVWQRRRPTVHRAMMFTGTLGATAAAISRINPLSNLYLGTAWEHVFGPYFMALLLGVALLGLRCVVTRSFDRWLALGVGAQIGLSAFTMALARSQAWDSMASLLVT